MFKFFHPQVFSVIQEGYSFQQFLSDLVAGVITGIVAIPLAIAFGIASGVSPQAGLYTAIIAGFLISLLSGSRVQIGGPTGAFIVIVYGVIQKFEMEGLLVATLMAGVILLAMGILRFGTIIKYIPYPVTLGFTSGIALLIATTQLKDALGLDMDKVPVEFLDKLHAYYHSLATTDLWAVGVTVLSVVIVVVTPKFSKRIPGSLLAIIFGMLIVSCFQLPVTTIGTQFPNLEIGLPKFSIPKITYEMVKELVPSAVAIAMLGAIESLLSAVVADGMIGGRHRSNTELIAQGVANLATPFFGGIPATGAIARTAVNVKNGGRTPFAGMIHAVVLLIAVICLGRLVAVIPMAVLAGLLLVVSLNMSEYRFFLRMFKAPKSDIAVMLATFTLTVLLDLTVAIPIGMVMASFLFMRRMEQNFGADIVQSLRPISKDDPSEDPEALAVYEVPDGVQIYEINGPFFFGAASKFQSVIQDNMPIVLIIRMLHVPVMDATGMYALEDVIKRAKRRKSAVMIAGIQSPVLKVLRKFGIIEQIGEENVCQTLVEALPKAADIVQDILYFRAASRRGWSQSRIIKKIVTPMSKAKIAVEPVSLDEEIRVDVAHFPLQSDPHAIATSTTDMDSMLIVGGQDRDQSTIKPQVLQDESIIIIKQEQPDTTAATGDVSPIEGVMDVEQITGVVLETTTHLPEETLVEINTSVTTTQGNIPDSDDVDREEPEEDPVVREIRQAVIDEAIQPSVLLAGENPASLSVSQQSDVNDIP